MTDEEEGRLIAKLAREATREAFERHKAANRGPAVVVGTEIHRIWADGTYTVIKDNLPPNIKIKKGTIIKI